MSFWWNQLLLRLHERILSAGIDPEHVWSEFSLKKHNRYIIVRVTVNVKAKGYSWDTNKYLKGGNGEEAISASMREENPEFF